MNIRLPFIRLVFASVLFMVTQPVFANPVDGEKAARVAQNFMMRNCGRPVTVSETFPRPIADPLSSII